MFRQLVQRASKTICRPSIASNIPSCQYLSTEAITRPKLSVVEHPVSATDDSLQAVLEKNDDFFAVVGLCGSQFKVGKGDVLNVEKIPEAKVGEIMELSNVMLLGSKDKTIVGRPVVPGALVKVRVEEQTLDEKVIVFKMKRRKNYRRKQGHRRPVTILRVLDIVE